MHIRASCSLHKVTLSLREVPLLLRYLTMMCWKTRSLYVLDMQAHRHVASLMLSFCMEFKKPMKPRMQPATKDGISPPMGS